MSSGAEQYRPGLIERLDLMLADRFSAVLGPSSEQRIVDIQARELSLSAEDRSEWISGLLAVRNYRVSGEDVRVILEGGECRFNEEHQEFGLVHGLGRVIELIESQAGNGNWPDGEHLIERLGFSRFTIEMGTHTSGTSAGVSPMNSAGATPTTVCGI